MTAFFRRLSALWTPFTEGRPSLYAAGAGFYLLLSLFPAVVFLLGLLSRFPTVLELALELFRSAVPQHFLPLIEAVEEELSSGSRTTVLSVSALTTLWSASKGVMSLTDGFHVLFGKQDQRSFLCRRLSAIVHFLLLAVCLAATFSLMVLSGRLFRHIPGLAALIPLGVVFYFLYSVLPGAKLPVWSKAVGSAAAAVGWMAFSALFSLYIEHISGLQTGLGFLVLALIWLHICMTLLLYGGILTKLLAEKSYHPIRILRAALFPTCS